MAYNGENVYNQKTVYNSKGIYKGGVYNDNKILLYSICDRCEDNKDIPIVGESKVFSDYQFLNPGYKFWGNGRILYDNLDGLKKFTIKCKSSNSMNYSGAFRTPFKLCVATFDSGISYSNFRQKFSIWVDNVEFNDYTTNLYNEQHGDQKFFLIGNAGLTKTIDFIYEQDNKLKVFFDNDLKITFNNVPRSIFNNTVVLKNFAPTVDDMYLYELFASK